MKTKKLLATSIATLLIGVTSFSLVGCSTDNSKEDQTNDTFTFITENTPIAVEENGITTLHKGYAYSQYKGAGLYGVVGASTPILRFNCGKGLTTNLFVAYTFSNPTQENYDEICEICYGKEQD